MVEINLPPLRAHKEDIPELVAHFIATLAPRLGVPPMEVSADELAYLAQYDWPGNVRELRNLIERSLILGALNVSALYQGLARMEAGARRCATASTAVPDDAARAGEAAHPRGARSRWRRQDTRRAAVGRLAAHAGAALPPSGPGPDRAARIGSA